MLEKRFKHVNPCLWLVSQTRGVQRGLNRGCYALPSSFGVWDTTNRIQKVAWRPKIKRYDFNWFQVLVGRQYYIRIITYTVTVLNSIHICSTYIYIDRCVCVSVCVVCLAGRWFLYWRLWQYWGASWDPGWGDEFHAAVSDQGLETVCAWLDAWLFVIFPLFAGYLYIVWALRKLMLCPQALGDTKPFWMAWWCRLVDWNWGVHQRIFDEWTSGSYP
jgi:hypothetical protein